MPTRPDSPLAALRAASARIGRNPERVQAGGGNTSWKQDGTLWVKASGKWLVDAEREEIFLPVPLDAIERSIAAGVEYKEPVTLPSGETLRPSVETTMHAALPHPAVTHVHSVNTIAWASRAWPSDADAQEALDRALGEPIAVWVSYVHPGLPLTQEITRRRASRPASIVVMENHGLVVGADSCVATEALIDRVEEALAVPLRSVAPPRWDALAADGWVLPAEEYVHLLGTDAHARAVACGGTMYPDHCVYLGPEAAEWREWEALAVAVARYEARWQTRPLALLVAGAGVLVSPTLSRAAEEMLGCLARVAHRVPIGQAMRYISDAEVYGLMNWDAEKYRQGMAR